MRQDQNEKGSFSENEAYQSKNPLTYNNNHNHDQSSKASNGVKRFFIPALIIALIAGFFGGQQWTKRQYSIMNEDGFQLLQASYDRIHQKYLYDFDNEQLINGAIAGMVSSLGDQYSQFLPDEEGEQYVESYQSNFYGIGAEIRMENNRYFISSLIKDMPAEKAGLKPDDEIIQVDRQDIEGLSFNKLLSMVRGEKGTKVIIGVKRAGAEQVLEFEMERAEIPMHTVYSERLEQDIGVITITSFKQNTDKEFADALNDLQQEGKLKGLVIDLRSNPGGLLDQTINIASLFVPEGEKILDVVYKDERRSRSFVSRKGEKYDLPIAVIINEYSASASEVLSAALKETVGAHVVGVTSYGKGVVQSFEAFRDDSVLVLTEAEWKTPKGNSIHKTGVEPTHVVELPSYANLRAIPSDVELQLGSYGENVETLRKYLQALGYSISLEGNFDEELEQVLKQYEQKNGLTVDGKYTAADGASIIENIRQLLADNDTQLDKAIELLHQGNS